MKSGPLLQLGKYIFQVKKEKKKEIYELLFSHGCHVMASGFARGHVHMTMTKATESCEEDGGRTDGLRRRRRAYSS